VSPASAELSLSRRRAFASVSEFGNGFLVAGGIDPVTDGSQPALLDSAERYDTELRGFDQALITLKEARARHAAITLDTGDVLLVGGLGASGAALPTLEAVSPISGRSTLFGLATLRSARVDPVLLRLEDGRLVVAGGTSRDTSGTEHPIGVVEWLRADGSAPASPPPLTFEARFDRAYVALPGSGLLGVGGCEDRPVAADCGTGCGRGCRPSAGYSAEWISAEGIATRIALDFDAPAPVLISATDGAPLLVAGDRVFRFDPWQARFEPLLASPPELPARTPAVEDAAPWPPPVTLDGGVFVWLHGTPPGTSLLGFRHSIRSVYAQDLELLGNTDPVDSLRPLHLVPDRAPSAEGDPVAVRFERDALGRPLLRLGFAHVVVPDARYLDFDMELELEAGPLPIIALGADEVGGAECPWPDVEPELPAVMRVTRTGRRVELVSGEQRAACPVGDHRTTLALRGGGFEPSLLRRIEVTRRASQRR
jgi:hypothetical protein